MRSELSVSKALELDEIYLHREQLCWVSQAWCWDPQAFEAPSGEDELLSQTFC